MREFQAAFGIDPRSESPYQQFVGFAPFLDWPAAGIALRKARDSTR